MSLLSPSPPLSELTLRQIQWIGAGYVLCFSTMAGQTLFIAQFNPSLRAEFSLSHGEMGGLYTLATLMSSVLLVWAGGLADKIAPRRLGIAAMAGLALVALGMSLVFSPVMLVFLLFGLRFFGQGMIGHISMTTMSRWFNRFRGRALSFAQLGFASGEAVLPFILVTAIAAFGWRSVWVMAAGVLMLVLAPLVFFLLRDPPDGKKAKARGEVNPDATPEDAGRGSSWTRGKVVRDPLFWTLLPGVMGPPAIGTLYIFHQAHLNALKGWDLTTFALFFPVMSLAAICTSVVTGFLIDRFGAWRMMPFLLIPEAVAATLIATSDGFWVIPFFFLTLGLTNGMMSPTLGAIWAELYGTAHIGAIRAMASAALVLASAVGPGFAGAMIDLGMDLDAQSVLYAGYCLASAAGFALLAPWYGRRVAQNAVA